CLGGHHAGDFGTLKMYVALAASLAPLTIYGIMKFVPTLFRSDTKVSVFLTLTLAAVPFCLVMGWYLWQAYTLRAISQSDMEHATASTKLMPTIGEMWESFRIAAFVPDNNGHYQLWEDIVASSKRFAWGMGIVSIGGLFIGLYMGVFPIVEKV